MSTLDPRRESAEGGAALVSTARLPAPRSVRRPERSALLLGSPRAILARIVAGDPLQLRPIVVRRLVERRYLMDAGRVHRRALVLCARHAGRYRGRPGLERWLERQIDAAIDALLEEEGGSPAEEGPWAVLAAPLGLAAEAMCCAAGEFNRLPVEVREAFFRLVLEKVSLDELARLSPRSATELARQARRALQIFLDRTAEESGA